MVVAVEKAVVDAAEMLLEKTFRKPHPRPGVVERVAEKWILHPKLEQETLLHLSQQKVVPKKQEGVAVLAVRACADAVAWAACAPYRDIVGSACPERRPDGPSSVASFLRKKQEAATVNSKYGNEAHSRYIK